MIFCEVCQKDITNLTVCEGWGMTLCGKHYQQRLKYGHFLDNNPYSTFDRNDFRIVGDSAYIILRNKKGNFVKEAIIDKEDLDRVIVHKWRFWKGRVFTGNYNPISLQYFVLSEEKPKGVGNKVIDHINGNPLDNQKRNLRVVTQKENCLNKCLLSNNQTGFCGLWYDKGRKKWVAEIKAEKQKCFLGRFEKKEDAVFTRYYAEQKLFGEYRSNRNDSKIEENIKSCVNIEALKNNVEMRLIEKYHI